MIREIGKGFFLDEIKDGNSAISTPLFVRSKEEAREELEKKRKHTSGNCCFRDRMREMVVQIRRERGI